MNSAYNILENKNIENGNEMCSLNIESEDKIKNVNEMAVVVEIDPSQLNPQTFLGTDVTQHSKFESEVSLNIQKPKKIGQEFDDFITESDSGVSLGKFRFCFLIFFIMHVLNV